jgi:hypothetical protein
MPSVARPTAATYDGRFHRGRLSPLYPNPDSGDLRIGPSVWIILAEDALIAGRIGQAEELVEQAYRVYDEAMPNLTADRLRSWEEEAELDSE